MNYPLINVQNIYKTFHVADQDVQVLSDISFDINLSDFLIIHGPSGCGKSTLLHTILGLERPSKGQITFFGTKLFNGLTEDNMAELRRKYVGMVYQQSNWIRSLNVLENVAFPLLLDGVEKGKTLEQARKMLEIVGLSDWWDYSPVELSSGQQQMVSLARALVTDPEIIIADEPTGNLDYDTGNKLMEFLHNLNKEGNKTIVMVTHDLDYLKYANVKIRMLDGKILEKYNGNGNDDKYSKSKIKHGNGTA